MKKFFCAMMFAFMFGALASTVQPVKADTLDERVGALAVDTALSSFADVLPSPEQVNALGGVQSWLEKVGQQFKEAWERDNRNWQNFIDSADTLVNESYDAVINVPLTVLQDVREVIHNFLDLVFGIEYSEEPPFDAENTGTGSLGWYIDSFNFSANSESHYIYFGDLVGSGSYQKKFIHGSYSLGSSVDIFWSNNETSKVSGRYSSSGSVYYGDAYVHVPSTLYVLYWGLPPRICNWQTRNELMPSAFSVSLINMATWSGGSENDFSFSPSVNSNYYNKYYFGFGNASNVSPSHIVNNYDTVYNYVTNNYYTDAVREIKDTPKGYYVSPTVPNGNGISINGIGDITIDLPNADGFGDLFGDSDSSEVFAIENSSWLSFINILPQSILIMLFIAIAVGCVCCVIKAVR